MIYSFKNDYSEGAHPRIIKALADLSNVQNCAYGEDSHSSAAADYIRKICNSPKSGVAFIGGGTATNVMAICALLRNPYESAMCAVTGHINVHETGAIEYTGHKVTEIPSPVEGKLTPELVADVLKRYHSEHMILPKLVYISQSTELGTIYSKAELTALSKYCREHGLYLYLDGARLGSALASKENDLTLADIASLTDAFYIGGTKNGLLYGEALVMQNEEMQDNIRRLIKQKGLMIAKGFAVGVQFEEALKDDLFMEMAGYANEAAEKIKAAIVESGFEFFTKPQTNQLFVTLPDSLAKEAEEKFDCNIDTELENGYSVIRIVTSWNTPEWAIKEISEWFKNNAKV